MSVEYDNYINQHVQNVLNAAEWLRRNINLDIPPMINVGRTGLFNHDQSKWEKEEYDAYDAYFYGARLTKEVKDNFNYAWLHHIHNNPHHWQYWILINDNPDEGEIIMDMPYNYIVEMICDWWAFSWKDEKLNEIFEWYEEHKEYMKLSDTTRHTVETILIRIKEKLED